jgi:hypothetical protein
MGDGSTQIDHILINHYGIFIIETKNYIGKIYGFENAENWKKYVYGNNQPYEFYNPIKQNEKHLKNLQRILNDDQINFTSIVVFSDQADIRNVDATSLVVNVRNLRKSIRRFRGNLLSKEKRLEIFRQLLNYQNDHFISNHDHVKNIKSNEKAIANNLCPVCGGNLIPKQGKYGTFIACSNYPKCKFIKKRWKTEVKK